MATTLTSTLSSNSFLLAYSLPLLFSSFVLTFGGAFLTLDRTRSFAPRYDALPGAFTQKRKFQFILEGGVGGLLLGFSFGLHLATFLTLLVPNTSSLRPLSQNSFLATWLLSSLLTTFLGGRYKYAALAFAGLTGGTAFALSLSVIIHPSLLTRIVLTCIITPLLLTLTLLPLQKTQRPALRFATSSAGAFGVVIAIALLANPKIVAWADVWERYWMKSSVEWGTGREKGLSAGFCLFLVVGVGVDWLLKRIWGECPDEKWDTYLANYTSNLPNRAGTFKPYESLWSRWFSKSSKSNSNKFPSNGKGDDEIIFPDDSKYPPHLPHRKSSRNTLSGSPRPPFSHAYSGAFSATTTIVEDSDVEKEKDVLSSVPNLSKYQDPYEVPLSQSPNILKKSRSNSTTPNTKGLGFSAKTKVKAKAKSKGFGFGKDRKREAVKFVPGGGLDDSSDDDDDDNDEASKRTAVGSGGAGSANSGSAGKVDIDYEKELEKLRVRRRGLGEGEIPEYSDYESGGEGESDITSKGRKEWTPGFIRRASVASGSSKSGVSGGSSSTLVAGPIGTGTLSPGGGGMVPATPSLLKALDRVALAQRDAYGSLPSRDVNSKDKVGLPPVEEEHGGGERWQSFWRDVRDRASS